MSIKTHHYTKGDLTVVWKPEQCIHSTLCWKNLDAVFNPRIRPWINLEAADADRIREQVLACPSGALSLLENQKNENSCTNNNEANNNIVINITSDGPLMIADECVIKHADGREEIRTTKTFLCRCGASANKPYCDGSHKKTGFKG